jgi:hypothetical protein
VASLLWRRRWRAFLTRASIKSIMLAAESELRADSRLDLAAASRSKR